MPRSWYKHKHVLLLLGCGFGVVAMDAVDYGDTLLFAEAAVRRFLLGLLA